jgi:hypothetical protein
MNRLERLLHERILPKPIRQTSEELSRTWVLAGSGRSGTSWLAEMLVAALDYRYLWEPFHPDQWPVLQGLLPGRSPFLPPEEENPRLEAVVEQVLSGHLNRPWVNSRSPLGRLRPYPGRVIKDIRINGMLAWMVRHFPEPHYLLVFRHPYAVVQSRVQLGWDAALQHYQQQPQLMEELAPYRALLEKAQTPWEQQTLRWCIETYLPLRHLRPGQVRIYCYEELLRQARESPGQLLAMVLGAEWQGPGKIAARRSSSSTTGLEQAWRRLENWEKQLDPERMACTLDYLQTFGLDKLYGQGPFPHTLDPQTLLRGQSAP